MCSFMCVCMYVYLYILKDILLRVQKTFICLQQHMLHKGEGRRWRRRKRSRPVLEIGLGKVKMLSVCDNKSHQNFIAENLFKKIVKLPMPPFLLHG